MEKKTTLNPLNESCPVTLSKVANTAPHNLQKPFAVFDAGIGSYRVVDLIRNTYPQQDIIYFADRASFPYGKKSRDELLQIMLRTIRFLSQYDPAAIIIASNAPSVMVYDQVQSPDFPSIFGVFPPIHEAIAMSHSKKIGVLGVQSLFESQEILAYIHREARQLGKALVFNASPLVELVESGKFLFDNQFTTRVVRQFVEGILAKEPDIDIFTLSSTHLPWLVEYFSSLYPDISFLDPAESVVETLSDHVQSGKGNVLGLVTSNEQYPIEDFLMMLKRLRIEIPIIPINIDQK